MEINTIVKHKKLSKLGIGCVSKILSKSVRVNFGLDDTKTCKIEQLETIDTSKCKTISFRDYSHRVLNDKSKLEYAIVGNELKHFVGIGWLTQKVIEEDDLKKYPRVI